MLFNPFQFVKLISIVFFPKESFTFLQSFILDLKLCEAEMKRSDTEARDAGYLYIAVASTYSVPPFKEATPENSTSIYPINVSG